MLTTKVAGYKGKTVRSWAELPTEAIQYAPRFMGFPPFYSSVSDCRSPRSLATWYLNITAPTRPLPATWDFYTNPEHKHRYIPYPEYLIYVAARDAKAGEALMCVCTRWGVTLEQHPFWTHAIQCFDPYGACAHFAWSATFSSGNATSSFVATTPFHHFRAILHTSCLPCRINFPQSNTGLGSARWTVNTLRLGMVKVCGEHFSSAGGDVNTIDVNSRRGSRHCSVCLVDGDLAKRARDDAVRVARDELKRAEWAVAQAVVVGCGYEGWQAVGDAAAAGSGPAFAGSGSVGADLVSSPRGATNTIPDECYDEDSSESDDDPLGNEEDESLDMAVKEMALTDWARARVLDGAWAAPADVHNRMKDGVRLADADPYVPAVHPVHWSRRVAPLLQQRRSVRAIGTVGWIDAASQCHPGPPTQPPPTQCLAEKANNAFVKQMRSILLPVFSNVVRRLVIDYAIDPVEVQASLLTGAANSSNPPQHITQVQGRKPLPPAICAARMTIAEVVQQLREEVGLWFDGPQLLREIPHVPQSIDHLSQNSKEVLIIIWREACTPLYQCRCSICERATLVQAALQGETSDATKIIDKAQAKGNTPRHCIMPMHAEDDNETGADDSFSLDGAEDETIRDEKPFLFHPTPATWAAPPHIFPKLSEADEGCAEVHHPSSAKTSRKRACNLQGDLVDAMDAASVGSALKRSRVDLI
ncbi:hypothetical protein R3P38DRAFT_3531396 [Favolaschia claudopus]|uniref:Uncharacterized protein n=1 Tax=Favolaschia claudopus TaxID=2862362 RepID=A0AAW0BH43_9AGAR